MADRPIDLFLATLPNVKDVGHNKWSFSCPTPAHKRGDKSPSAFMKVTDYDKPPLLYCSMGCGYHDIIGAMGYSYTDIMPSKADRKPTKQRGISPVDALRMMTDAMYVMLICAEQMKTGELSESHRLELYAAIRSAHHVAKLSGVKL
jgi:hypothetical protein